jgi:hypothetical protein
MAATEPRGRFGAGFRVLVGWPNFSLRKISSMSSRERRAVWKGCQQGARRYQDSVGTNLWEEQPRDRHKAGIKHSPNDVQSVA